MPVPMRVSDTPQWEPHYKSLAKLIKFPILTTKMEADLAILPPKSWGKVDPHTLKPIEATPPEKKKKNKFGDVECEVCHRIEI